MGSSRCLLIRSPLLPGESLVSYITRLTELNRYDSNSVIESLCEGIPRKDSILLPKRSETFQRMEELFRVDQLEIAQATPHVFATVLVPGDSSAHNNPANIVTLSNGASVHLLPADMAVRHMFTGGVSQFCSKCLHESRYHRLIWSIPTVVLCIQHHELLRTRCPTCGRLTKIVDVARAKCTACAGRLDLSKSTDYPIGFHHESQSQLQGWLTGTLTSNLYYHPPSQPANLLYSLYEDVRLIIALSLKSYGLEKHIGDVRVQSNTMSLANELLKKMDARKRFFLHIRAFQALANWPNGFEKFLSQYPIERDKTIVYQTGDPRVRGNFAPLLAFQQNSKNYGFVSHAFRSWLAVSKPKSAVALEYTGSDADSAPLSQRKVSDLLGISSAYVPSLIDAGFLCEYDNYADSRTQYITCESMNSFMSSIEKKISVAEVYSYAINELVSLADAHAMFIEAGLQFVDVIHYLLDKSTVFCVPINRHGWNIRDLLCIETSLRAWVGSRTPK